MSPSRQPANVIDTEAVPGWFHHGPKILELLDQHRPKVCVELGSWLGASAIPVARSIRRWGGTLTCVDTWGGDIHTTTAKSPWMLVSCARNIIDGGVGPSVRLIPSESVIAGQHWSGPIDYLYVDADHSEQACAADLAAWFPHVRPGGLIVGDDYDNPLFPGVKSAWESFAREHSIELTRYQSDPPHPEGIRLVYGFKGDQS